MVWLLVRISRDESERIPRPGEDVLAALPTRATRALMNGNHTALFNAEAMTQWGAVSHKV